MRHYEIIFLVHPDQSDQVPAMIERYQGMINAGSGTIHRMEDWGRRLLAYPIKNIHKAHYVLMNIECSAESLKQLTEAFHFNDAVIRNLVVKRGRAITGPSPLIKFKEEEGTTAEPVSVPATAQAGSDAAIEQPPLQQPVPDESAQVDEPAETSAAETIKQED